MKDNMIGSCMVTHPFSLEPYVSVKAAAKLLRTKKIRHLPVILDKKLVGIVSDRDIRVALALPQASILTVGDIMTRDVYIANQTTPLSEVAYEMAEQKLGSALIVNSKQHVVGIFTTTDALRILSTLAEEGTLAEYVEESDYETWAFEGGEPRLDSMDDDSLS